MATARTDLTAATGPTTPQMMAVAGRPIDRWVKRIFWFPDPADLDPPPLIDVCPGIGVETWPALMRLGIPGGKNPTPRQKIPNPGRPHPGPRGIRGSGGAGKPAEFIYPGRCFGEYQLLAAAPNKGHHLNLFFGDFPYKKALGLIDTLADYRKAVVSSKGRWLNQHARHRPFLIWCQSLIQSPETTSRAYSPGMTPFPLSHHPIGSRHASHPYPAVFARHRPDRRQAGTVHLVRM